MARQPEWAAPMAMLATPTTRQLLVDEDNEEQVLPEAGIAEKHEAQRIDLGGKVVELTSRKGHTPSDVTIELKEPKVVWCGDLVWNRMFPNYVDAIPSHLTRNCEAILGRKRTTYVPGHGDMGDAKDLGSYLALIKDVERAARGAVERGTPAV